MGRPNHLQQGYQGWFYFFSLAKARRLIQHGFSGYLTYVVDTCEEQKFLIVDFMIVHDFLDVVPEDLPGVPLER